MLLTFAQYKQQFHSQNPPEEPYEVQCLNCGEHCCCMDTYVIGPDRQRGWFHYLCPSCAVGDD
jgi:hypothetical protein